MAAVTRSLVAFAHVADVERSIKFYADLGFRVSHNVVPEGQAAPVWAWLESGAANLMVGLASGPIDSSQQAILFYLYYDDIKETHAALAGLGYEPGEIKYPFYMPGGEFRLEDPDGYVLMLAQIWISPHEAPQQPKASRHGSVPQSGDDLMHYSRLCAVLIDCNTPDVDEAAEFWSAALGRAIDPDHPGTRGNYRMLETPPDEPIVQIQRVGHESRAHIDIETDDIPAEVARLEKLGARIVDRLERWVVMQAPTGQRFCVVRVQRPGFPRNANQWD